MSELPTQWFTGHTYSTPQLILLIGKHATLIQELTVYHMVPTTFTDTPLNQARVIYHEPEPC